MYDKYSLKATEFIDDTEIKDTIAWAEENKDNLTLINKIIDKTDELKGLTHREAALLLMCEDEQALQRIFEQASKIKTFCVFDFSTPDGSTHFMSFITHNQVPIGNLQLLLQGFISG